MVMKITSKRAWRGFKCGQQEALLHKLWLAAGGERGGEEALRTLLRSDEMRITLVENVVTLVDQNGRRIPLKNIGGGVVQANSDNYIVRPLINYAAILGRLQRFFGPEVQFVSVEEFEEQAKVLIRELTHDKQAKNLLKGSYLPLAFPKLEITDYGRTLEEVFLIAAKHSYLDAFPDRIFYNLRAGTLAGQVGIVEGVRHDKLIQKMAKGPVVGIWFPNPLQGFSVAADREQIAAFGEGMSLSGAIDTATAWVASPLTFARDFNVPGLKCAANSWMGRGHTLCFVAYDDHGTFIGYGGHDVGPNKNFSSSLLFLGN